MANFPNKLDIYFNHSINVVKRGAFLNLPLVTEIMLQNDKIHTVEVGVFTNLPSLDTIHINYNRIRSLEPNTFDNLPELEVVHMDHNQLEYFEQEWFKNTPKLTVINGDNNLIRTIPRGSFADIPSLEYLLLHENQINHIHRHAFSGATNLTFLNLGYNRIKTLDVDFSALPMTTLLLYVNNLTYIPDKVLQDIRYSITQFEVYGNPLQCLCHNKIMQWSKENKLVDPFKRCRVNNPVCVNLQTTATACLENVSDQVAQELDSIFHGQYNYSCGSSN